MFFILGYSGACLCEISTPSEVRVCELRERDVASEPPSLRHSANSIGALGDPVSCCHRQRGALARVSPTAS